MRKFIWLFLICLPFAFAGCRPPAKRYELVGTVISVDKAKQKAKIQHEDVGDYMKAMTMDFPIRDSMFNQLEPSDKIAGDLVVENNGDYYIEKLSLMKQTRDSATNRVIEPTEAGADKIGLEVPDFTLTNQDNKKIGFHDFRGKVLFVTFIFTRCPDANMCPLMSGNFADLEKELRKNPALAANTRLLSVTFDPQFDTPVVLKKYGAAYQNNGDKTNFDIWQLATGDEKQIRAVTDFFGVTAQRNEDGQIVHNVRTAIVSQDGKVYKIYANNTWKVADALRDLQAFQAGEQ